MGDFEDFKDKAINSFRVAVYVSTDTYPAVKEPKLLLAIVDDLFISMDYLMKAVLSKKDVDFDDQFISLFMYFKSAAKEFGFDDEDFDHVFRIHKLIDDHKKSAVEFSRNDKFIICGDNYKLEPIGVEDVKGYIFKSRHLLNRLESIK